MLTTPFIQDRLRTVTTERNISIRYACESGSRAWGLASTDSDYDVRFIYQHPREWYLQLNSPKDMIGPIMELDGELDLVGWDVRKVLSHVAGSNAGVIEWLHSPVHYFLDPSFRSELRELAGIYFQPSKVAAHYLGIARSAVLAGYDKEVNSWNLKKYCYFMRPILAARYVITERSNPPVAFADLMDLIPEASVRREIDDLISIKQSVSEGHRLVLPKIIAAYFDQLRDELQEELTQVARRAVDYGEANSFFRRTIGY